MKVMLRSVRTGCSAFRNCFIRHVPGITFSPDSLYDIIGMAIQSDFDLARRAQRGDIDAYGEIVHRYQRAVFNTCYRLLGERREAEDLAQEAFLHAYQRLQLLRSTAPVWPVDAACRYQPVPEPDADQISCPGSPR